MAEDSRALSQLADCLVAAVALHDGLAVLHHDRDFEGIAEHTGLVLGLDAAA